MTPYSIILFLHIVGALGLFMSLGLEWASLAYMRRASTAEQAHEWLGLRSWVVRLGPLSLGLILLTGLYLVATQWGWMGWIVVALASLVLIAIIGATLTGLPMGAIQKGVTAERGQVSPALRQRLNDSRLWISIVMRTSIALGIVFLMAVKPDGVGSLITIGVAVVLGVATTLPMWRRARSKREEALSRP